ncbi:MAG: phospho-N-acetylmuramoyl-pentapeptide-transferase, partial [Synergistaceae bacterium]|nr:phospho-N-acetylmuramoyl-pentapeptide-transferase [Synergistaceae bacterium]
MNAIFAGTAAFLAGAALQRGWIGVQRRLRVVQAQKSYGVGIDVDIKSSTPAMGGVVFIVLGLAFLASGFPPGEGGALFWFFPLASGAVGLADDWLKFSRRSSEGFTSLRKLAAQLAVASVWVLAVFARGGLSLWPGIACPPLLLVPLTVVAAAGMVNAVNITDGLDGLAGGAFLISLGVLACFLPSSLPRPLSPAFAVFFGMAGSFLLYNVRPARTFMGDAGSHFLGGALTALCVSSGAAGAFLPAGFLFWIELLSSAVQIAAIRVF